MSSLCPTAYRSPSLRSVKREAVHNWGSKTSRRPGLLNGRLTSTTACPFWKRDTQLGLASPPLKVPRQHQTSLTFYQSFSHAMAQPAKTKHRAFVALGSNLGDRVVMIEQACKEMDQTGKIKVLRTSSLWETKAMYVLDQDKFVNGVCEVSAPGF